MSRTMLAADEPPVLLAGGATTRADVAPWAHHDRGRLLAHRQPVVDALLERLRGLSLRELRTAAPAALRELTLSFCGRDTLASLDSLLDGCAHLPEPARLRATASIARTVELVGRDLPGLSAALNELRDLLRDAAADAEDEGAPQYASDSALEGAFQVGARLERIRTGLQVGPQLYDSWCPPAEPEPDRMSRDCGYQTGSDMETACIAGVRHVRRLSRRPNVEPHGATQIELSALFPPVCLRCADPDHGHDAHDALNGGAE